MEFSESNEIAESFLISGDPIMASIAGESTVTVAQSHESVSCGSRIGQEQARASSGRLRLLRIVQVAVAILMCKVLLSILVEYQHYFPANFEAAFLSGRRHTFLGWYRVGFYTHIITGPVAILLAAFLMASSGVYRFRRSHRVAGRTLGMLVIFVLLPSSLVMAKEAYAGPVASLGFAVLAIATAVTCVLAAIRARSREMKGHKRWATRCFVLLCSPLLLRLMSGFAIVTGLESDLTYRMNAWLSWLVPLVAYEAWLRWNTQFRFPFTQEVAK
jgi:hypothetical protein